MNRTEYSNAAKQWLHENRGLVLFMQDLASLPDLEGEVSNLNVQKESAKKELSKINADKAAAADELQKAKAAVAEADKQAKDTIAATGERAANLELDAVERVRALKETNEAELKAERDRTSAEVATATKRHKTLMAEIAEAEGELKRIRSAINEVRAKLEA